MAGDGFTVDPEALRELGRRLVVLTAKLADARAITQRVDGAAFGSAELSEATASFTDRWQWQVERLSTTLHDTSSRLIDAARQYQEVEDAQLRMQGMRE